MPRIMNTEGPQRMFGRFNGPFEGIVQDLVRRHTRNTTDKLFILRVKWFGSVIFEHKTTITKNTVLDTQDDIPIVIVGQFEAELLVEYMFYSS